MISLSRVALALASLGTLAAGCSSTSPGSSADPSSTSPSGDDDDHGEGGDGSVAPGASGSSVDASGTDAGAGGDATAPGAGDSGSAHPDDAGDAGAGDAGDACSGASCDLSANTISGCALGQPGDYINQNIADAPVNPNSAADIASVGADGNTTGFYFANEQVANVIAASTPSVPTKQLRTYHGLPKSTYFQSGFFYEGPTTQPGSGDHDFIAFDSRTCTAYEFYQGQFDGAALAAYSGLSYNVSAANPGVPLPAGQSQSSASYLPHIPLSVRGEEWPSNGGSGIHHALGISAWAASLCNSSVAPAASDDVNLPRFRGHPNRRDNARGVFDGEATAKEAESVHAGVQGGGGAPLSDRRPHGRAGRGGSRSDRDCSA